MAIAFDASAEGIGPTNSLVFAHTPVGTPKGIIVFVVLTGTSSTIVSGVTYGGTTMTEQAGSPNIESAGEQGQVRCYFLGSSVPTGAQNVVVSLTSAVAVWAGSISVTATGDTSVVDTDATINGTAVANASCTLSLGGQDCFCAIGFYSGTNAPTNNLPLTNWTNRQDHDFGTETGGMYSYDIIGSTDVTAGWTQPSGSAAGYAIALKDDSAAAAGHPAIRRFGLLPGFQLYEVGRQYGSFN